MEESEYVQKEAELLIAIVGYGNTFSIEEIYNQFPNLLPTLYTFLVTIERLRYDRYIRLIPAGTVTGKLLYKVTGAGTEAAAQYNSLH